MGPMAWAWVRTCAQVEPVLSGSDRGDGGSHEEGLQAFRRGTDRRLSGGGTTREQKGEPRVSFVRSHDR